MSPKSHPKRCFSGCPEEAKEIFRSQNPRSTWMSQLPSPVLHPCDRPPAGGQHPGAGVPFPLLKLGFESLPLHKALILQKGQSGQAEDEDVQLHLRLHAGLFPIAQGKRVHIHPSYPTPTPSGHPEASPPSLGKLLGTPDAVN